MYPFEAPTTMSISGTTGSGKTYWVKKLLTFSKELFSDKPPFKILYCFGLWQPQYEEMENNIPNITFNKGLPTISQIESISAEKKHSIVVLDDLMSEVVKNSEIEHLFTRGAHHKNLSIIFLNQNMFCQGKNAKTINLNCHYLVLFKNLRDSSQIRRLGQQIFPGESSLLVDAYKDCMQEPYGYLVVDLSPVSHQKHRLRTHIFPGEDTIVFLPHGTV
jgi:hypothetical protein